MQLTINGDTKQVRDPESGEGRTILECLREAGFQVPTLCHHKALKPYGACRLCLVEVESNGKGPAVQTSCMYPAEEGMAIRTDTARLMRNRKIMIELLLARSPESKVVQKLADHYGVKEVRISKKDENCIYCGLCIRMCEERMGRAAIGFIGRGAIREVEPPFKRDNEECWACGACDFICPTGKAVASETRHIDPIAIQDEYNMGLNPRPSIYQMYPQMVPNAPTIDKNTCVQLRYDQCGTCQVICEAGAVKYDDEDRTQVLEVGAVILAPGYEGFQAETAGEFGYRRYPNVITSFEFERILSATGPFRGHILRPYDRTVPKKIAFIQCVGSRNTQHMYCSSVCCMYATKEAVIAREHNPDLDCTILYRDIRAFGKGYEEYYERAKAEGIHYIKASPSTVKQEPGTKNLRLQYNDGGNGGSGSGGDAMLDEEFDLVVLCVGIVSGPSKMIGELLDIEVNEDGFIAVDPYDPVKTTRDGIYVAGVSTGPKDIPEVVMEADAAASRCLNLLSGARGQLITHEEFPPERDISGEEPRVGVFICHCGTNIAGVVNVPDVVEYTKTLPGVVYAENNLYTCSADTCEKIRETIIDKQLNRLVVASCTPRTHEPLFMDTMKQAGLNPYLFEMANIRDQCSWVHMSQPEEATLKSKDLVRMAVAKVSMNENLYPQFVDVTKAALVIGAGTAGMTAARELAGQGFGVFLVEKEKDTGGHALTINHSVDGDLKKKIGELADAVSSHPNIRLFTGAEIHAVEGTVPRFETVIKTGEEETRVEHGIIIVATGAHEYTPTEYLYGQNDNVLTQTRFEELLANGDGKVTAPRDIVMIQCVGSREEPRDYCSRVCCTVAIKNALKLKELNPFSNVYILNRDIRTYGFYEKLYREAREQGVIFIRYDGEKPVVTEKDGKLNVSVLDRLLDMNLDLAADLVVLSAGIAPDEANKDLAQKLRVPLTKHGFFLEAHMKLRPVDFATDGIFVCGTAHSPKNVPETILQSMAASTRAGVILSSEQMEIEPRISEPIDANCDGCAYCIEPCPYNAISLIEYMRKGAVKKTVDVDVTLCHGCGTCMATCPKQGIYVRNFKLEQLGAQVNAALEVA
jgi:heterodisulfide reductase subunit A